jgi:sortase A
MRGLSWLAQRQALAAFEALEQPAAGPPPSVSEPMPAPAGTPGDVDQSDVDQSRWDARRIRAYTRALTRPARPPLAVLRIPRLGLEVPVLEGTGEWTLDRAVGHIEGTARPGRAGNVGIAGHRDGFFRALKDVAEGDVIELVVPGGVQRYRVDRLAVVGPREVRVLAPTRSPRLTLVTCYPFYFVGPAPRRYIVQATAR